MTIYTVQPGDTLLSISRRWAVPPGKIAEDNGLQETTPLAVGESLILLPSTETYTVQAGDTVMGIAARYGIDPDEILYQNPQLTDPDSLYVGQVLTVRGGVPKLGTLAVNGYAHDTVEGDVLQRTLPNVTYLTVFGYGITPQGGLIAANDGAVLQQVAESRAAPLMLLTALNETGGFSSENAAAMLSDPQARSRLVNEVDRVVAEKGYRGVDVDFEFIPPENAEEYVALVSELADRLRPQGKLTFVALAPKTSDDQSGILYEAHDYARLGAAADGVLLMTYEWGFAYSEPMAIAPINRVEQVVRYGLSRIPAYKIFMGIPNYAYDWPLPRRSGERARTITNNEALWLARNRGAEIQYDEVAQSPFFQYTAADGRAHEVWFEDARSLEAKLRLVGGESLFGTGVWNVMSYYAPLWTLTKTLFTVREDR